MEKVNEHFSKKITWLSFFLSVLVIYIHANNLQNVGYIGNSSSLDYIVTKLIGGALGGCANPFFFMMAAYWLFRFDIFKDGYSILYSKQKKRIRTILVPYVLWNSIGFVFYACVTRIPFISAFMNNSELIDVTPISVINGVLFHSQYFVFWFLQDLICLILISPIILFLLKRKKAYIFLIILVGILSFFVKSLWIFQTSSLFFFMVGAYCSSYLRQWFEKRYDKFLIVFSCLLLLVRVISYMFENETINAITLLYSPICICIVGDLINDYRISWFKKQSFFVYAAHIIPVTIVMKIFSRVAVSAGGDITATICYLITPVLTILILYLLAKFMNKVTPRVYSLLCGGR